MATYSETLIRPRTFRRRTGKAITAPRPLSDFRIETPSTIADRLAWQGIRSATITRWRLQRLINTPARPHVSIIKAAIYAFAAIMIVWIVAAALTPA